MSSRNKLRELWFAHYWWCSLCFCLLVAIGFGAAHFYKLSGFESPTQIANWIGGICASYFALIYFVQKQKLDEDRLVRDLFRDFNDRYDAIRADLNSVLIGNGDLAPQETITADRYLNLCAEEYFFYSTGRVPERVWKAWSLGMISLLKCPRMLEYAGKELKSDSYYGFSLFVLGMKLESIV